MFTNVRRQRGKIWVRDRVRLRGAYSGRCDKWQRFINVEIKVVIKVILVEVNPTVEGAQHGGARIGHFDFSLDAGRLKRFGVGGDDRVGA